MTDRDEDLDLDRPEVAKALLGEKAVKKKAKAKTKAKSRKKEDGETKISAKQAATLPLSMLSASNDDVAMFDAKANSHKSGVANARAYNMTDRFKVGEVMNHKKFGVGFVLAESGKNKIEVLFRIGRKLMIMAQPKAGK